MNQTPDLKATRLTQSRYQRASSCYDRAESPLEWLAFHRWRRLLWSQVRGEGGHILELGVGTGKNFPHYPAGRPVAALDLTPGMLARAQARRAEDGVAVELLLMDAQALAFPDATFDAVIATFVFCSIPDPVLGLREAGRVLKAGGQVLLLEHMRSDGPLGWAMDRLNAATVRVGGENINRRTVENVRRAGLAVRREEHLWGDIFRLIEAAKEEGP
ncbi:MAG: methyltransferase domain-containing protein [Chloroflexi bacterium]|nr:methyltransferase domain-containing protein [Chloroflexota bacterium]